MSFYEQFMKLNKNKVNTFLKNYQNLFNELFSYDVDNVNVYDIVFERAEKIINAGSDKWNKLPKYLQIFLDNPENFKKFFDKLSKYGLDSTDIITYSNTDVLHLLSFATFHLCKIYYILNYQENPDFKIKIYKYYIKPFDDYLTILFENGPYDFANSANAGYRDSIGIFHTIQYLLLLTFSSYGLKTTYTILYGYLDGIYLNYQPDEMRFYDMNEDFIKPLFEVNFVDIYGFDLRRCFKAESTVPDFVISADYGKYYHKAFLRIDNYYDKNKCLEYLKLQNIKGHHIEQYKLLLFAVIKLFNKDNYMYDLDNNGYIINDNDKWNVTLKDIWELLENTKDLRKDYNYIINIFKDSNLLHYYWPVTNFNRYDVYENILFPIIKNNHQLNDLFIVEIIQKCLEKDNGILDPSDIIRLNSHNQDIILLLLQKFFGPKITDDNTNIMIPDVDVTPMFENSTDSSITSRRSPSSVHSSVSLSRSQSAGKLKGQQRFRKFKPIKGGFTWQLRPDIASSNTSPSGPSVEIMKERCLLYKPIISVLLKYKIKEINQEIWVNPNTIADQRPNRGINYYKTLHAYKDDLLSIGIDLNKYHMDKIIYSEPQYTPSRRSVDKSIDINEPIPETHIFHGFLPADQKKVLQKIIKLYTRVVQSDDQSKNNYDRIVKIRNYLIKKLKKQDIPYDDIDYVRLFVKKLTVRENKELEDFYNYWIKTLKKGNLNLQYIFEYQGRPGIDMKSLTRQILTQIAEQLKTHFVALEDTNRYILRPDISRDMGNFIGQIIALLILHNIHLPFSLSNMYLGHMMFNKDSISNEELFLYYVLDLRSATKKNYIEYCKSLVAENDTDDRCVPAEVVKTKIPEIYGKKQIVPHDFIRGFRFYIYKNIFYTKFRNINDKIRIFDLDKLLSYSRLTIRELKTYVFNDNREGQTLLPVSLTIIDSEGITSNMDNSSIEFQIYEFLKSIMLENKTQTFNEMYNACSNDDLHNIIVRINDPVIIERKAKYKSMNAFKQAVMMFWTGSQCVLSGEGYTVSIYHGIDRPLSRACFNHLNLPANIDSQQQLYNMFMKLFVLDQHKVFDLA